MLPIELKTDFLEAGFQVHGAETGGRVCAFDVSAENVRKIARDGRDPLRYFCRGFGSAVVAGAVVDDPDFRWHQDGDDPLENFTEFHSEAVNDFVLGRWVATGDAKYIIELIRRANFRDGSTSGIHCSMDAAQTLNAADGNPYLVGLLAARGYKVGAVGPWHAQPATDEFIHDLFPAMVESWGSPAVLVPEEPSPVWPEADASLYPAPEAVAPPMAAAPPDRLSSGALLEARLGAIEGGVRFCCEALQMLLEDAGLGEASPEGGLVQIDMGYSAGVDGELPTLAVDPSNPGAAVG